MELATIVRLKLESAKACYILSELSGRLAQLGEHRVRNAGVAGSSPAPSTNSPSKQLELTLLEEMTGSFPALGGGVIEDGSVEAPGHFGSHLALGILSGDGGFTSFQNPRGCQAVEAMLQGEIGAPPHPFPQEGFLLFESDDDPHIDDPLSRSIIFRSAE